MKYLFFPENPKGLYGIAGLYSFGSLFAFWDTEGGLTIDLLSILACLLNLGLAAGLLYRKYFVWVATVIFLTLSILTSGIALMSVGFVLLGASNFFPVFLLIATPLGINATVLWYLNRDSIRELFGLVSLGTDGTANQ